MEEVSTLGERFLLPDILLSLFCFVVFMILTCDQCRSRTLFVRGTGALRCAASVYRQRGRHVSCNGGTSSVSSASPSGAERRPSAASFPAEATSSSDPGRGVIIPKHGEDCPALQTFFAVNHYTRSRPIVFDRTRSVKFMIRHVSVINPRASVNAPAGVYPQLRFHI